jgi:hypothetical protein
LCLQSDLPLRNHALVLPGFPLAAHKKFLSQLTADNGKNFRCAQQTKTLEAIRINDCARTI